ncbi:recombination protein RecT, partial [Pseudomonas aeruginosa]
MAKKTVIRRLFKYLPVSIELQTAVTLDERADAGLDQDNASILTGEYSVVDDQSQDQVPDCVNTETGEITEPAPGQQSDTGDTGTDELNLE